jgi:ATP-dependent HslUV protease subunit HslV
VTLGQTVVKHGAKKIRRLHNGKVLAGFAGASGDAFALLARFESRIEEYRGNLERAAVELSKEWRTDRVLRRLEAFLIVMDREASFMLSGSGDVIAPDPDGLLAVGSGGPYALAAARALVQHADLDAAALVREAMRIAAGICVYTNDEIVVESL